MYKKGCFFVAVGYILFSDQNGPVPTDLGQCPWPLSFCNILRQTLLSYGRPGTDRRRLVLGYQVFPSGIDGSIPSRQLWSYLFCFLLHSIHLPRGDHVGRDLTSQFLRHRYLTLRPQSSNPRFNLKRLSHSESHPVRAIAALSALANSFALSS